MADGQRVVVYYQTQYDRSLEANSPYGHYVSPLPLILVCTHLLLSAFHIDMFNKETIHLNDNVPEDPMFDQMWDDIAQMQSQGVIVQAMIGGAAPGSYEALNQENFDTYYPQLTAYIKKYNIDGVDLDIEQFTLLDDVVNLVTHLRSDFGSDFVITMAPVATAMLDSWNLSGFNYTELDHLVGHAIDFNVQFYSGFGSIFPDDQYIDMVNAGWSPNRIVAGTLTNPTNGGGWVDPDSVVDSIESLVTLYGSDFGGVAGWEYFNSLPNQEKPWEWANLMRRSMKGSVERHPVGVINSRISGNVRRRPRPSKEGEKPVISFSRL